MRTPAHSLALDEFPRRYESIVRFLRRRLGCAEEAREVAHEAWLRLAERGPDDAGAGDARAYLYTVAANLGLDRQRRAQWLQGYLSQTDADTHVPDVADGLMYRQALDALDATLAALPARMREVFAAHRVHGEKQAEIAIRLGVSLNTVERDLIAANDKVEAALRRWRGETALGGGRAGKGRRKSLASLLGLAAVGVLGATAGWRHWQVQALRWTSAFATPHGRRLQQPLPDGSALTLDAQTRVDVAFDEHRRAVRLWEGAAFFAVAADAGRPFVVAAGEVTVTVLGTRFGVEIDPAGGVWVQVESGRVRVEHGGRVLAQGLTAGHALRVMPDGAVQPASGPASPWRQGRVHFDAVPLGQAIERLSRYTTFDLRADDKAAPLRISGTVEVAHLGDWLRALPAALPLRVVRGPDGTVLLAGR